MKGDGPWYIYIYIYIYIYLYSHSLVQFAIIITLKNIYTIIHKPNLLINIQGEGVKNHTSINRRMS